MLATLSIRNYALIQDLEVEFGRGLNILTGETGAGKSIIIGALKLVLGERASTSAIRSGARKAWIEAVFEGVDSAEVNNVLDEASIDILPNLILRREVGPTQSRAFINDSPATLVVLRRVASDLLDLHGQHEHQSLLKTEKHVAILDSFGRLGGLQSTYRQHYEEVARLQATLTATIAEQGALESQRAALAFEISEIDGIAPETDEESQLEDEHRRMEHAERLFSLTASLYELLYARDESTSDQLVIARNQLEDAAKYDRAFEVMVNEISSAQVAVQEAASFLQEYNASIEFSSTRLDAIRERLGELDRLKRKYGGSLEAVMHYREEIGARHALAENFDSAISEIQSQIVAAKRRLSTAALRLSEKRHEVAERIEGAISSELASLGITGSLFEVRSERVAGTDGWIELGPSGCPGTRFVALRDGMDKVEFYISTNIGEAPKPLASVVSGGEVSRIMLALKRILARNKRLPALVFDEIDSGVSGVVATKVAECLRSLARYHQVIAITHLPQIAAVAERHFVVEKSVEDSRTVSRIRPLAHDERAQHVAELFAGAAITGVELESARALMERTGG